MKNLKETRKNKNLTQENLANLLNVAISTYSQWENDIRQPSIENLKKLADALTVSVDYLIGREQEDGIIAISTDLSRREAEWLANFRKMNNLAQEKVLTYMQGLMDAPALTLRAKP